MQVCHSKSLQRLMCDLMGRGYGGETAARCTWGQAAAHGVVSTLSRALRTQARTGDGRG